MSDQTPDTPPCGYCDGTGGVGTLTCPACEGRSERDTPPDPKWQPHPYVSQIGGDACMVCGGWRESKQHKPAIAEDKAARVQHAIKRLNDATSMMGWPPSAHAAIRERDTARAQSEAQHQQEMAERDNFAQAERSAAVRAELRADRAEAERDALQLALSPESKLTGLALVALAEAYREDSELVDKLTAERDAAQQEIADLKAERAETDESWMARVYSCHMWSPDDGGSYAAFCRQARTAWEREHTQLRAENARLREALEGLLDEQNDAPLERRRVQWEAAVDAGRAALVALERVSTPLYDACDVIPSGGTLKDEMAKLRAALEAVNRAALNAAVDAALAPPTPEDA